MQGVYDVYLHSLIPAVERHRGFRALLLLWDPDPGEALEITLWQDEDARRASEEEGGPVKQKLDALSGILGGTPTFQTYQLRLIS